MKEVKLTNSFQVALVNDEDFERVSKYSWRLDDGGYAISGGWRMHEIILGYCSGKEIDHINGNGLNNQRLNLRHATHSQNLANTGPHKNNTSGYKGVWYKQGGSSRRSGWVAEIRVNYKKIYLGIFNTIEEAARAYDRAAIKHFGEFAYTNFPKTNYP